MTNSQSSHPEGDSHLVQPQGVVELREDVPLKSALGAGGVKGGCCAGAGVPRVVIVSFAALSAAVTLALVTQIYAGDYQVVPHGAVSAGAAACSRAGTAALKAGGRAVDAAAAAALCLAVVAPHQASIDSSGSLLYWEYRSSRTVQPTLVEWDELSSNSSSQLAGRPPRLLVALTDLHARFGALPWSQVLQPVIQLARTGFPVSESLAEAEQAANAGAGDAGAAGGVATAVVAGSLQTAPLLADYLETFINNSSAELSSAWSSYNKLRWSTAVPRVVGGWRVWAGGERAGAAVDALAAGLEPPAKDLDDTLARVVSELQLRATREQWGEERGAASGLAVVDTSDTYVALVTGVSSLFGSGSEQLGGWRADEPLEPLDLAPAIIAEKQICGTRYVIGGESAAALAQGVAALTSPGAGVEAVERARVTVGAGGARGEAAGDGVRALNLVQQRGDALASHADSRTRSLASRF